MAPELVPVAFFSYCREDSEFALKLAADLKEAGAHVWIDQLDIEPGTPWDRAVEDALTHSPHMLVVLSPVSVKSDNVRDEVSFALSRQKRVIPVLYRDCDVPFRLARLQHIDFRADYERALTILLRALGVGHAAHSQGSSSAVAAAVVESAAPVETQEQAGREQEEQQAAVEAQVRQEQSRREQRLAEQARLEAEGRLAAERVRLAQEEKERREAEIKARQEQLRREEQESVERKSVRVEPAPERRQPRIRQVPDAVPEARVDPLKQTPAAGLNLTPAKNLVIGGAIVFVLGFIVLLVFVLNHRFRAEKAPANTAESKTAVQQPQAPGPSSNTPADSTSPATQTSPAGSSKQDESKEKPAPPTADKEPAKAKDAARAAAELSNFATNGAQPGAGNASSPTNAATAATPSRVHVARAVSEGMLTHKVKPTYPPLARSARVQGQVVLDVVIGKDGRVKEINAKPGAHPMLIPAAIDAVKQWRYKPYVLNGQRVEFDTQVSVNFTLTN